MHSVIEHIHGIAIMTVGSGSDPKVSLLTNLQKSVIGS